MHLHDMWTQSEGWDRGLKLLSSLQAPQGLGQDLHLLIIMYPTCASCKHLVTSYPCLWSCLCGKSLSMSSLITCFHILPP